MNRAEEELELRLNALPDGCPDFTKCGMHILKGTGLVDEVLDVLRRDPDATVDTVTMFESEYRGKLEFFDENDERIPVDVNRLKLTRGMREILAQMKGKTFKSYEIAPTAGAGAGAILTDCSVRVNLGQRAVDINCLRFTYSLCGGRVALSQLLCERRSLYDAFRQWADDPVRTRLVGERITGVELATDHVASEGGLALDIDSAVGVRTAHGVYTFARESWESTGIRVVSSEELHVPPSADELNAEWLRAHPELGEAKVTRTTERLA